MFVFWEEKIIRNVASLRQGWQRLKCPVRIFYACKANANLAILKLLVRLGLDLEVNSGGELFKGLKAGFRPDQIIFNGVGKTREELKEAICAGIHCLNVDSLSELRDIVELSKGLRKNTRIALRLVPEVRDGGHAGLETGHSEAKFGMPPAHIPEACRLIKKAFPWLSLIGLHAHVGSQLTSPLSYRNALERLLRLKEQVETLLSVQLEHLNLGGGLPVDYRHGAQGSQECPGPEQSFTRAFGPEEVAQVLDDLVPKDVYLYFEPGRSVVGDTALLLTRVIRKKKTLPGGTPWLVLDAGFNVLLEAFSYNWYFHLIAAERPKAPHDTGYFVAGPLCDGGDVFPIPGTPCPFYHRLLPAQIEEGELLAFLDTGAYTLEQMTYYNGRLPAAAILIDTSGEPKIIRKRETYAALLALEE